MRQISFNAVDLNLLRTFDAIFRERHLTRAGASLCVTQSAMSHALSRLRTLFGDELFVRTTHGLEPTRRALELARPISEAIESIQRALASASGFEPGQARLQFRLGITDFSSWVVLPRLVARLRREAPGVALRTTHVNIETARDLLDRGQLDLALVASGEHPPRFVSRHALAEPYVCLLARNHPTIGDVLTEEAFLASEHVLIVPSEDQRSIVDRMLAERNRQRRIAVSAPFLAGIPRLVASTELLCTVPQSLAEELSAFGDLRWLPLPLPRVVVEYFAVWNARDEQVPSHRWLRELTLESCAQGGDRHESPQAPYPSHSAPGSSTPSTKRGTRTSARSRKGTGARSGRTSR